MENTKQNITDLKIEAVNALRDVINGLKHTQTPTKRIGSGLRETCMMIQ